MKVEFLSNSQNGECVQHHFFMNTNTVTSCFFISSSHLAWNFTPFLPQEVLGIAPRTGFGTALKVRCDIGPMFSSKSFNETDLGQKITLARKCETRVCPTVCQ